MAKKTYTPMPTGVPPEQMLRLARVVEVLAGLKTMSAGARELELSRNHFQSMVHRGVMALLDEIAPKPGGRPAKSEKVAALEAEVAKLRKENARLSERVGMTDRLLKVASGLLHGQIQSTGRAKRTKTTKKGETTSESGDDPDPAWRRTLKAVEQMESYGLTKPLAAAIAGVHVSTVRRWKALARRGGPLLVGLGAGRGFPRASLETRQRAAGVVRSLNGLVGAESLRRTVEGISRREAAHVKAETLTEMERNRKAGLTKVTVTTPGVVRGIDAMHFATPEGTRFALIAGDAAVPYRTSHAVNDVYDSDFVERTLRADFDANGAPLVYRLDRFSAHKSEGPLRLFAEYGVLVLHGPPHCPRYCGQLERQNLEHRQWCEAAGILHAGELETRLAEMLKAVSEIWRRRTLGFQTAAEVWNARPRLNVDRAELRSEVRDRTERIRSKMELRGKPADIAERLAIQQTLETRGYLRQEVGGWC